MSRSSYGLYCRFGALLLVLVIVCCWSSADAWSQKGVRLTDIQVLTLHSDRKTKGSKPIDQLRCVGGSAASSRFYPDVVQCVNVGTDGVDVQWKCEADMPKQIKFGRLEVSCEGLTHPNDPYVVKGSCGLEYTLESSGHDSYKPSGGSYSAAMVLAVFFGVFVLYVCCRTDHTSRTAPYPDASRPGPSFNTRSSAPPPGFKTTYTGDTGSATDGPGFWSGMMAGGGLGYLFGRSQQTGPDIRSRTTPFSSPYSNRDSYTSYRNDSDNETHTSTGYAETKRR
jgi:hypothetical protein